MSLLEKAHMLALPGDVKTLPPGQPVRVVGSLLAFEIDTMVLTLAHRSQQVRIRAQLLGPIPIRKGDVWTILGDVAEPQVCSPCACDLFNVPGGRNPHKAFSHREMERWRDGEMEGKGRGSFPLTLLLFFTSCAGRCGRCGGPIGETNAGSRPDLA